MIQSAPPRRRSERQRASQAEPHPVTRLVPRARNAFPCECGSARCRATVPVGAEAYRGRVGRLIVTPEHRGDGTIIRAADRFFVIEAP